MADVLQRGALRLTQPEVPKQPTEPLRDIDNTESSNKRNNLSGQFSSQQNACWRKNTQSPWKFILGKETFAKPKTQGICFSWVDTD